MSNGAPEVGNTVTHETLGSGKVTGITVGRMTLVKVHFPRFGKKEFIWEFVRGRVKVACGDGGKQS